MCLSIHTCVYVYLSLSLSHLSLSFISLLLILAVWNYEGGSAYQLSLSVGDLVVIIERFGGLFTFVSSLLFFLFYVCVCACVIFIFI